MVKAADLLDAYMKCLSELSSGNREFAVAKGQTEKELAKLGMPEVDWFLTNMAPSFSKTLDELSEMRVSLVIYTECEIEQQRSDCE